MNYDIIITLVTKQHIKKVQKKGIKGFCVVYDYAGKADISKGY